MWSQPWNFVSRVIPFAMGSDNGSAGVCGIVRTVALDGLNASEYICKSPLPFS